MVRAGKETAGQLAAAIGASLHNQDQTLERKYGSDDLLVPPVVELSVVRLADGFEHHGLRWSFHGTPGKLDGRRADRALRAGLRRKPSADAVRDYWNLVQYPRPTEKKAGRRVLPGTGLLQSFLELGEPGAKPEDFLRYARRWGVLGICEKHGVPGSHDLDYAHGYCKPRAWNDRLASGWEPIEKWYYYAQIARSVVIVAHRLRKGETLDWADVELRPLESYLAFRQILTGRLRWLPIKTRPMTRDQALKKLAKVVSDRLEGKPSRVWKTKLEPLDVWQVVTDVVNEWVALGGVRPWLLLERALGGQRARALRVASSVVPRFVMAPEFRGVLTPSFPLFGTLAIQLMIVVASETGLDLCASCGKPFEPIHGRQKYCKGEGCGRRASNRAAQTRFRAKSTRAQA